LPDPKPAKSRFPVRLVLALAGVALALAAGLTWLNRKTLAREALTGWLKSKGVAAQTQVEAVGPSTFVARLTLGDPRHPDFAAERAEVRYRMKLGGLEVVSVTLRKPVLRASLHQGRLAMGSLDPLVQEFLRRPPRPDVRKPLIRIDDGVLVLATDYGPVRLAADARVDDGKLQQLVATSAPARLRGAGFDVTIGQGALRETTHGGRLAASFEAPLPRMTAAGISAVDARLQLRLEAPYPDLMKRRGDGLVVAAASLAGRQVAFGDRSFAHATVATAFTGQSSGWIADLAVSGRATGDLRADGGRFGGANLAAVRAALAADDLRWTRTGSDRVAGRVTLSASLDDLSAGGLRMAGLTTAFTGPVAASRRGVEAALTGSAIGRGGWSGLGAPMPADGPQLAAVKRAARSFSLAAPGVSVAMKGGALTVALPKPLRLVPDSGGVVELAARPGAPVIGPSGGAFRLVTSGGGLPGVEADVARFTLAADGAVAAGRLRTHGSFGFVEGGEMDAAGRLQIARGGLRFTGERCVAWKAARLEFGANDVERPSGQLCPAGGPLFTMSGGDWRIAGRAAGVSAAAPFLQARVDAGAGPIAATSRGGQVSAQGDIAAARLTDTAPQGRFNPVTLTGHATLSDFVWTADLAVARPAGGMLGRAHLVHDTGIGVGFVTLATDTLTFAEGGLQPAELSPMATAVGSPANGQARFEGRFDWARIGAGSSGTLSLKDLAFQSPAGRVEGLSGEIAFVSLAPLTAAPGQTLEVATVQAIVPLTHLHARFALADNLLKIEGGEALVGGGRVRVESLEAPLTPDGTMRGVLIVEGVQLHDLVEASPFGDKVDLDAKVSGRIAFESAGNRVRVSAGELKADQPGRISIDRTALTGVTADTAVAGPAPVNDPNATFTDFAYQAMENLAFDKLEATVASRDDGRLGVLFHIVGRHDPPTRQKIKLSVMDLINKRFLGRKLPLPSGTGVNLTLDTTLNLDDLLADYADYRRLHGSAEVQPPPAKETP
jgi:hypothetical protein